MLQTLRVSLNSNLVQRNSNVDILARFFVYPIQSLYLIKKTTKFPNFTIAARRLVILYQNIFDR